MLGSKTPTLEELYVRERDRLMRKCKGAKGDFFERLTLLSHKFPHITPIIKSGDTYLKTYDEEAAYQVFDAALEGNEEADHFLRIHAYEYIFADIPLPDALRGFILMLLAKQIASPKKRKRRANEERNSAIYDLVNLMRLKGYQLERNPALKTDKESACSMTCKLLRENGIHISEKAVAQTYRRFKKSVPSYK